MPVLANILKLRRIRGNMVDDEVSHDGVIRAQRRDVLPVAEPGIDAGMVDRIEAGVRAIYWIEKRQDVDAREQAAELVAEQCRRVLLFPRPPRLLELSLAFASSNDSVEVDSGSPGILPS